MTEMMIEFRLHDPPNERILMRVSQMLCLFLDHHQIRTTENGWTVTVHSNDWARVERTFRLAFLGGKVHAMDAE